MGCGCGKSSDSKVVALSGAQEAKLRKLEAVMFTKIMKMDLNLGQDPEMPIEAWFTV
jgi:hypothetical protein